MFISRACLFFFCVMNRLHSIRYKEIIKRAEQSRHGLFKHAGTIGISSTESNPVSLKYEVKKCLQVNREAVET
jgi:hypothetical protein